LPVTNGVTATDHPESDAREVLNYWARSHVVSDVGPVPPGTNGRVAIVFDTVLGLPVHALVVHGVVVLLPLMAIVTAVVACVPRWRARAAWPVVVIDAGMVAMTFVARQSGEALQRRLGGQVAQQHAALGKNLFWFAFAMFLASLVVAMIHRSQRVTLGAIFAVVAGVLVVVWTVRVGHSGADALWSGIVASTNPR